MKFNGKMSEGYWKKLFSTRQEEENSLQNNSSGENTKKRGFQQIRGGVSVQNTPPP